ncbi:MAG: hypothetical protein AUJ52_02795 [Elusimicrobia bacterium CG1_02_63_36]|nr:MAG: hypothetical protein AUJ52_02795 [Elusimicrobia bacterium CG1_02_63_36]
MTRRALFCALLLTAPAAGAAVRIEYRIGDGPWVLGAHASPRDGPTSPRAADSTFRPISLSTETGRSTA